MIASALVQHHGTWILFSISNSSIARDWHISSVKGNHLLRSYRDNLLLKNLACVAEQHPNTFAWTGEDIDANSTIQSAPQVAAQSPFHVGESRRILYLAYEYLELAVRKGDWVVNEARQLHSLTIIYSATYRLAVLLS
jgi:hypothetical protein